MAKVKVHGDTRYQQHIEAGEHRLRADEGRALGGDDTGPDPYELLLSSLGACTAITLRMYAERKGWDLGRIEVALRFQRDENGNESIQRTLHCGGDLNDEQLDRLLEIAGKTPVTKTLRQGTAIDSHWDREAR